MTKEIKSCKDCKHYQEISYKAGLKRYVCDRKSYEMKNPVTGEIYIDGYLDCYSERDNYGFPKGFARIFFGFSDSCGHEARHFVQK